MSELLLSKDIRVKWLEAFLAAMLSGPVEKLGADDEDGPYNEEEAMRLLFRPAFERAFAAIGCTLCEAQNTGSSISMTATYPIAGSQIRVVLHRDDILHNVEVVTRFSVDKDRVVRATGPFIIPNLYEVHEDLH